MSITHPNQSWGYHAQSGVGVDGVDSWNPDEFTPGDQHFGSIVGRDVYSHFGRSVDTDFQGTRLVGGGPEYDNDRGYIQIYDWSETSTTWTSLQQINGPSAGGWFGESISMDYDGVRIIVGAPKINTVYVYDVGSNGLFSLSQTISTSDDTFGHSVSIAGDKADRFAVGAPNINSVFVYERNSSGTFVRVHTSDGSNIINRVPYEPPGNVNEWVYLFSKFNGYGFSVKMSGFGEHIIVGSPGTEIAEIQSTQHAGTLTPGPISHHLGEHVISSQGPHYVASQYQSLSKSCNTQVLPNVRNLAASHPYSVYKYPGSQSNNSGNIANGLRFSDSYGQKHHYDRSPYGTNSNNMQDGYLYPNFQLGNIRVIKCPAGGSWSSGVTTVQTIEGRNNNTVVRLDIWNVISSSFPGFGRSVSISVDGKRICAGSPGFKPFGYDAQVQHGDVRYFVFNEDTGQYDEPMYTRESSVPSLGGPWHMLQKNGVSAGFNMSMTEDGSRVFVGSREHQYALIPYDFSGTTFYPTGPIIMSGGQGSGPNPTVFGTAAPVPDITGGIGCMNGYRSVARSGTNCAVSFPSYPEAYGAGSYGGTLTTPATSNGQGRGIILIYRFTLTSVFRGNSLFEGYVKCDNLTVGSSGGSLDHARIKFGGRKGEANSESGATIENRWLGTRNAVYTGESGSGYKHDNELLISKSYNTLHEPNDTVKYGDWNKRDFFGDRVRIKAPKIEFQIHTPQSDQLNNKYRESPCVSITDMNNPFGGERGMSYLSNPLADEPRQLMSIRTGTSNSRLQAGLRLIAGDSAGYVYSPEDLRSSIPPDGRYYTFAPGNDGWLRLLQPSSQGSIETAYQTETDGAGNYISSNYAPLAVGDLYVKGIISGPGAPGRWTQQGSAVYYTGGNVGVGTSNPQGPLHVVGRIVNGPNTSQLHYPPYTGIWISNISSGDATVGLSVSGTAAGDPYISFNIPYGSGWSWGVDNSDGDKMKLGQHWSGVNYNTRLTVQTNGGTGIGYDSIGSSDKLAVNGRTYSIGFYNASDDRIKYNETTIQNPLDLVNQLKPQKYDKLYEFPSTPEGYWIPTDEEWENVKDNHKHSPELGFIAQDVRKIPELSFLVSGDETEMMQKNISPDEYNTLDSAEQATYTSIYVHNTEETRINSEEYANLTTEEQEKYFLKYTKDIETQTPLSVDYNGLSVLTTSALQEVDRQLQAEKEKVATLETDVEHEKLKTTNLQERILAMEHAYHALLERVSVLENQA